MAQPARVGADDVGDEVTLLRSVGGAMSVAPGLERSFPRPRIVAILPAYNEEDVIGSVIRHYVEDGVEVYLIDNCSTDGTVEAASEFLGNGLLHIERFPDDVGGSSRAKSEYMWGEILERNEQLAATLGADWYIRADADEFRESPWPGLSHAQAITLVDALGYTAVQSQVLEFRPTDDSFPSGGDPRRHLLHYEPCDFSNMLWIKAWKQPPAGVPVAIARSGGHQAEFEGRHVCPVNFISRHYPIRTSEHARRKIFKERLARYPAEERAKGWHTHWDELAGTAADFLWDPADLIHWDLGHAQAAVLARASLDIMLTGLLQGFDAAARPVTDVNLPARFGHAAGGNPPITEDGLRFVVDGTKRMMAQALHDQPVDIPETEGFVNASLVLLDLWIADRRTKGEFYDAAGLERVRRMLLDHAEPVLARQRESAPIAAVPAPTEDDGPRLARNAPCWCGSGAKYKKCHGLQAAAA